LTTPGTFTGFFTATATSVNAPTNTSEFSAAQEISGTIVNTTSDVVANDGFTSFREAISFANATPGIQTITFNIPGSGVQTIVPTSALPAITDAVVINGYSQPGASANTLPIGNNATLLIELNGNGGNFNGLEIMAAGSTVKGLVLNRFANSGIRITNGGGNMIAGNFIGTDPSGAAARGNTNYGLFIGSSDNQIGGTNPADRNVISATTSTVVNLGIGVLVQNGSNNVFENNYIGTNAAGTAALGSLSGGLRIVDGANNRIGGTAAGAGNVISGNTGNYNVQVVGPAASGNVIQGNFVGTNATGTAALAGPSADGIQLIAPNNMIGGTIAGARNIISGNSGTGVRTFDFGAATGSGNVVIGNSIGLDVTVSVAVPNALVGIELSSTGPNTIGGGAPGEGNTIAFNGAGGVRVTSGAGQSIRGNSIFANSGLGIDIGGDGPTANDLGDADAGPNNLQNFPVLTSATKNAAVTAIAGTLNSIANATFTIDLYANASADPSGFGEGQTFLGSTTATTNASGNVSFNFNPANVAPGTAITAVATSAAGNSSEFAQSIPVITDYVWDGSAGSDWFTPANWTPDGVPGPGDRATLNINSTITFGSPVLVDGFTQTNGTIASAQSFGASSNYVWSGGTINAPVTIPVGATWSITGAASHAIATATVTNSGTAIWSGSGPIELSNSGGIINAAGATFNLQGNAAMVQVGGGISTFTNAGTFSKTIGTGTSSIAQGGFVNTGAVVTQTGTLAFTAAVTTGGAGGPNGSFSAGAGAQNTFSANNTFTNATFGGAGQNLLIGGTETLAGAINSTNLEV
ncbi:MAG TPA: hypothetical protein VFV83_06710, partial [Chthoniobacteraceae bacterium]|nr:hypothetical protein [Chthoniobacteraceae bacterium]